MPLLFDVKNVKKVARKMIALQIASVDLGCRAGRGVEQGMLGDRKVLARWLGKR